MTAGTAAVILGLVPLATFLLAVLQRLESFRWSALWGTALAVAGVAIVFYEQIAFAVPPLALLALLAATVSAAQSGIVAKRLPGVDPLWMNAIGMAVGAAFLFALSGALGEAQAIPTRTETWAAFLFLVTIGSLLLFFLYLFVLGRWTASGTAYSFVLFPVVATALGLWLAGDLVTAPLLAGSLLALAGVYVGALSRPPAAPVAPSTRPGPDSP